MLVEAIFQNARHFSNFGIWFSPFYFLSGWHRILWVTGTFLSPTFLVTTSVAATLPIWNTALSGVVSVFKTAGNYDSSLDPTVFILSLFKQFSINSMFSLHSMWPLPFRGLHWWLFDININIFFSPIIRQITCKCLLCCLLY